MQLWLCLFLNKIYLWLHWILVAACRLSLVAVSRGCPLAALHGFLVETASLVVEHRLSSLHVQQLGRTGLVASWHVGSSQSRDQTRVRCIGRQILNHWTTREALVLSLKYPGAGMDNKTWRTRVEMKSPVRLLHLGREWWLAIGLSWQGQG